MKLVLLACCLGLILTACGRKPEARIDPLEQRIRATAEAGIRRQLPGDVTFHDWEVRYYDRMDPYNTELDADHYFVHVTLRSADGRESRVNISIWRLPDRSLEDCRVVIALGKDGVPATMDEFVRSYREMEVASRAEKLRAASR